MQGLCEEEFCLHDQGKVYIVSSKMPTLHHSKQTTHTIVWVATHNAVTTDQAKLTELTRCLSLRLVIIASFTGRFLQVELIDTPALQANSET